MAIEVTAALLTLGVGVVLCLVLFIELMRRAPDCICNRNECGGECLKGKS